MTEECKEDKYIYWTSRCEELLYFFASHKAAGTLRENEFLSQSFDLCSELFARDGDIIMIDNDGKQELCDSYPLKIILPKSFMSHIECKKNDDLSHLLERARYARVHRRFVVPVIFLPNNACIARSSTLSTTGELLLNKATTVVSEALNYCANSMESPMGHDLNACRTADIKLLKYLNIKCICDLMVEDKKKVGWGRYALTVTSSEKVDREHRYKAFKLSSIPYPGCEFFKRYRDNKHNGNKLVFEWDHNIHDAKLTTIEDGMDWTKYKEWDIITLTQNYLRLILDYIHTYDGILIHCISGWDRTPLFISLIRISLWADGIVHSDLDCQEILYLTLSYDWLLFTHQLGNRLIKGEDIFHFTFYMLQYIINDRYSIFNNERKHNKKQQKEEIYVEPKKSKKEQILNRFKKLSKITKEKTLKISKATKNGIHKMKSRSNTNILTKYISSNNHFEVNTRHNEDIMDDNNDTIHDVMINSTMNNYKIHPITNGMMDHNEQYFSAFSPPIHIMIPNPLESKSKSVNMASTNTVINNNLSHSWEKKGCGPLSSNIRHSYIPTQSTPPSFTKNRMIYASPNTPSPHPVQMIRTHPNSVNNNKNTRSFSRLTSWQFVDEKNDSPMFQFVSTPKSDPHHVTVPELELNDSDSDNISSVSSGDIKINSKYSLSAPSSTKKREDIVSNPSPSPEVIAHPENNIIDMNDSNDNTAESMAKTVIHDVIDNVVIANTMKSAKSTPVTISDFLGLDGVRESVLYTKTNESETPNRTDRLLQLYALFNKIYTQIMIINDPPTFYKQSMDHDHNHSDDIDFVCSDDAYNNIATYLRSILPVSLIGNNTHYDDEYDD